MSKLVVSKVGKNFVNDRGILPVLSDMSFSIEAGKVLAVLGKSGSGKTTLLNIIAGLEEQDTGSIGFVGGVSYAPQKDLLLPWRTVAKNILLPLEIQNALSERDTSKVDSLLSEFELNDLSEAYPHELSGGMKQKVSIVRSLIQDQGLYLFDESLSAIDFDSRLKLLPKIRKYLVENNKVGLFVTHNIEEAITVADKVIVLGTKPAKIVYETDICISDNLRDPVQIRKNSEFINHFDRLWDVIANS